MDNTRNKFGVIVLGIILLFFIVGGYFFMDYMLKTPDKGKKNNKQEPEVVDLRINKSKDYIYYDNETEIIDDGASGVVDDATIKHTVVNINKADEKELQSLNGIGESLATSIVQYRKENGNFETIEDLKNVPGIGDSKFENIKEYIKVK